MNLRVYPHVYGATLGTTPLNCCQPGLSPCVWGHAAGQTMDANSEGSIPMCMGPPNSTAVLKAQIRVYPHVYGATQMGATLIPGTMGLSPCVWGHRTTQKWAALGKGSIPMCMGPPEMAIDRCLSRWVYPHVYGATV